MNVERIHVRVHERILSAVRIGSRERARHIVVGKAGGLGVCVSHGRDEPGVEVIRDGRWQARRVRDRGRIGVVIRS